jgi:hypothetical protein
VHDLLGHVRTVRAGALSGFVRNCFSGHDERN